MDETIQKWNHEFNIQNPDSFWMIAGTKVYSLDIDSVTSGTVVLNTGDLQTVYIKFNSYNRLEQNINLVGEFTSNFIGNNY